MFRKVYLLLGGLAALAAAVFFTDDPGHTVERSLIHFFVAPGLLLVSLSGFAFAQRKVSWWPSLNSWWAFIVPALVTLLLVGFREVYDVAQGGQLLKTNIDWVTWGAGLSVGIWGLYRMTAEFSSIKKQL